MVGREEQRVDLTKRSHEAVCRLAGIDPAENINASRLSLFDRIITYGAAYVNIFFCFAASLRARAQNLPKKVVFQSVLSYNHIRTAKGINLHTEAALWNSTPSP